MVPIELGVVIGAAAGTTTLLLYDDRPDTDGSRAADEAERRARSERHRRRIDRISHALRTRTSKGPMSLRKKAVRHEVPKPKDLRHRDEKVDISNLNEIIEIDLTNNTCTAESGVTFDDLVRATMRHNLVPIVVPELKTITIGGAVSGCSIESMSFRYGGFHDTCLEYEVVTAKGEVLHCTPDNHNALVFQMIHGGFGTLGILTRLKFRLIPAKPFVKMTYEKHATMDAYQAAMWRYVENNQYDFIDGIIHSEAEYVLCLGSFVDSAPYTHCYDWTRVYYQSTSTQTEDYLKTPDYFFRYDRGVTNVHPKSFMGRLLFGKFMDSSTLLRLAEKFKWALKTDKPDVILDVFVPRSKIAGFMEWYGKEFKFFPLWCVPYRRVRAYEWLSEKFLATTKDELFLDIAIYGMKQTGDRNAHKVMEEKLLEIGGLKTLISHNYFSEEDFWKIWNRKNYIKVKQQTDPHNVFRDLHAKTCRAMMGIEEAVGS